MIDDTIAAVATPMGSAGIGIIRVSGDNAIKIVDKVFKSKSGKKLAGIKSKSITYGHIIELDNKEIIDEVLVSLMLKPRSFTAEDVVEINCHGGMVAVRKTLETVIKAGARLAEPGEFSKRAFLNGRIDLAQAESIMDLINAKTASGLKVAIGQLEGKLSKEVQQIRNQLLSIIAHIEAGIDFPEHDIEELSKNEILKTTIDIKEKLETIIKAADYGKIFREGLKTVIVGKPNVGKSSLLNALVKEKRAIVTDVPGTTRDVIEEIVNIRGIPVKILDTAGIRETEDLVEKIGVERSRKALNDADFFILVIDAAEGVSQEDKKIASLLKETKGIILVNKTDLVENIKIDILEQLNLDVPIVYTSLLNGKGLEDLENTIIELVQTNDFDSFDEIIVSNVRHKNLLEEAYGYLEDVLITLESNMPTDCMAIDLNAAWGVLGKITGDTIEENILDQIFSQFCIGK